MPLRIAIAALALAPLLFTDGCSGPSRAAARDDNSSTQPLVVPVAAAIRSNLASTLVLTGEFIPYQEVDVMAKEAGYIKSIRVDIGDRVHAGQVLAELEIPEMQDDLARTAAATEAAQSEIAAAKGDLARAQSQHDMAALSYRRIVEVSQREAGLVPQQELDLAHAKELESAGQVAASKAALDTAMRKQSMAAAEQNRSKTLERYTIISAPFTGIITKRYANLGAMIQQGTASDTQALPVVRLSQNNLLRLIIPVPESAIASVPLGARVDVNVAALGRTLEGKVTRSEGKVALATRTLDTEIDVPNNDYTLLPGMYAEVDLHTRVSKNVIAVPLDAIDDSNGSAQLYVVRQSRIQIIPVNIGLKTADLAEVLSGITAGEQVIVGRRAGLENGMLVRAKLIPS